MKLHTEQITYGVHGPRQIAIGFVVSTHVSFWICIYKWVFYLGVKK